MYWYIAFVELCTKVPFGHAEQSMHHLFLHLLILEVCHQKHS